MSARLSVAVVGDNCLDRYLGSRGGTLVGGNALNVAIQLSQLGIPTRYFGAVGDDEPGCLVRRALQDHGVNIEGLVVLPGETAVTTIRIKGDGDREFVREDFGVTADYHPGSRAVDAIAECAWVHIGMLPGASCLRRAIELQQVTVSQDCDVAEGFDSLDVAFISAGDSDVCRAKVDRCVRAGVSTVVVTMGARGSVAHHNGTACMQRALPAVVVDTTGAGDSFIAGFIGDRMRGRTVRAALLSGARVASVTCGHFGGWRQRSHIIGEGV